MSPTPPVPTEVTLQIGSILGMENVAELRLALLDRLDVERLVVDLDGGERLHGAAFQLLAVFIRDRAATDRTTSFINATPAIEALLALAGIPDPLPLAPNAVAA